MVDADAWQIFEQKNLTFYTFCPIPSVRPKSVAAPLLKILKSLQKNLFISQFIYYLISY